MLARLLLSFQGLMKDHGGWNFLFLTPSCYFSLKDSTLVYFVFQELQIIRGEIARLTNELVIILPRMQLNQSSITSGYRCNYSSIPPFVYPRRWKFVWKGLHVWLWTVKLTFRLMITNCLTLTLVLDGHQKPTTLTIQKPSFVLIRPTSSFRPLLNQSSTVSNVCRKSSYLVPGISRWCLQEGLSRSAKA